MNRIRFVLVAVLATLVLAAGALAAAPAKLTGTVGPGFTIALKQGAKTATSLKAGRVTIAVSDKSNIHNFHLRGPGVNKDSGVRAVGKRTWTVTLKKGTYTFVCDPHSVAMKGRFTVR